MHLKSKLLKSYIVMCFGYLIALLIFAGGLFFIYKIARSEEVERSLKQGIEVQKVVVKYDSKMLNVGLAISCFGIVLGFFIITLGSLIKQTALLDYEVCKLKEIINKTSDVKKEGLNE
ncbi:MAG: hypothetical protein JXA60_01510 [Candidatus Coatesbacteria bacterium]|nr:hypothetical protein [Candidatus Coatesbacteria bacterium]